MKSRGSSLIAVLGFTALAGVAITYLGTSIIPKFVEQKRKSANLVGVDLALNSVLEYLKYAVANRWCFDSTLVRESGPNCNWASPLNTERLLINAGAANEIITFYSSMTPPVTVDPTLDSIPAGSGFMDIDPNAGGLANHPLFIILKSSKIPIETIGIRLERLNTTHMPTFGTEAYVRITVRLNMRQQGSGFSVLGGNPSYSKELLVGLYPREINTFALMAKGDLILSGKNSLPSPRGASLYFPTATTPNSGGAITFYSPVYANGDLIIPPTAANPAQQIYSPVRFNDVVILGDGVLKQGASPYMPPSFGGLSDGRLYEGNPNLHMRGLTHGVLLDAESDRGLDSMFGVSSVVNKALMNNCIDQNAVKSTLKQTDDSVLLFRYTGSSPLHSYTLGFSNMDAFIAPRDVSGGAAILAGNSYIDSVTYSGPAQNSSEWSNKSILRATVKIDSDQAKGELSINSEMKIKVKGEPGDLVRLRDVRIPNAIKLRDDAKDAKDNACATWTAACSPATVPPTTCTFGPAQPACDDATTAWQQKKVSVEQLTSELASLQSAYADGKEKAAFIIKTSEIETSPGNAHLSAIKFSVEASAFDVFPVDVTGTVPNKTAVKKQPPFEIELYPYDIGNHEKSGVPIRDTWRPSVSGGPNCRGSSCPSAKRDTNRLTFAITDSAFNATTSGTTISLTANPALGSANDFRILTTGGVDDASIEKVPIFDDANNPLILQKQCKTAGNFAFPFVNDFDFSGGTQTSWDFNPPPANVGDPRVITIKHIGTPTLTEVEDTKFHVYSIADHCIVDSSARYVFGFFTCNKLTIKPRSHPLIMIGTFIVGDLDIGSNTGVSWGTIYHPWALNILRDVRVLKKATGDSCAAIPNHDAPMWHPQLSAIDSANYRACSSEPLRAKADPFRWTTIDPVCGLESITSNVMSCNFKMRAKRFKVVDLYRGGVK